MLVLLLETIYLPRLGLTMQDLHTLGEQAEAAFADLKHFVVLYGVVVIAVLLAAAVGTNLWLPRNLFAHIREPLAALMQGQPPHPKRQPQCAHRLQKNDEFRPACDAVDEIAARLQESLAQQQREQQKKQELIAGMSHDLKSLLTTIRAYTEALLECVAPDEAARQRYLQTIYARETDLEALVNRLFELAKLGTSEYPVHPEPLPLRQTVDAILADCDREGLTLDSTAVGDSTVTADRELLGRILHNLIDNSCKYGATALKNLRRAVFLLLGAGVVVGLTLLRAHAGLWRAGGRGYLHQCYPRRAAKVPQPDDLADLGPDAWLTVRHRQWPRKFGRAAPGAEYGDLPACRLCVGRYRAAGAGRCENDDGT